LSIVYNGGTFDLFHIGHVQMLAACRKIAGPDGTVIVALNTDEFVEEFKKVRPTMSYTERAEVVSACKYVDLVVPNIGGVDSKLTIQKYGPVDFVVTGDDWAPPKNYYAQMSFTKDWLDEHNITVAYVDRNTGMSSTTIRERLKSK
jgi:glycerol-3-phosphate cytidylyltransferase